MDIMGRKEKETRNNMGFYTFIMEYDGGTYISQDRSGLETIKEVLISWAKDLDISVIEGVDENGRKDLLEDISDESNNPGLLRGLENIWCTSAIINKKFAIINIIKTSEA